MEIRASTVLPARRERITLRTADGLSLVGEVARPLDKDPVATLLCLHPLPTHGGMMDSHLFRKASYRLPALADLAVVRFNTRGTASDHGRSEGEFGEGMAERYDVAAAIAWCVAARLPRATFSAEIVHPGKDSWRNWVSSRASSQPASTSAPSTISPLMPEKQSK